MWICEFRTIQDSIEIIQFHAEQESVKEILFSAMLVTFQKAQHGHKNNVKNFLKI